MDPTYKDCYDKLRQSLEGCNNEQKLYKLQDFAKKFYVPPDDWKWLKIVENKFRGHPDWERYGITDEMQLNTVHRNRCEEHFEMKYPKELHNDIVFKTQFYEYNIAELENMLLYPHNHLKEVYNLLKRFGARPISAALDEKFNAVLNIVRELPIDEKKHNDESEQKVTNRILPDDHEEWIEFLEKIAYEKAVIANIELRLQKKQNYLNKNIWNYYIEFMKTQDPLGLLDVYRRYCRLFIDDDETREEFREEIERIGEMGMNVTEYWKECIKFELDFSTYESAVLLALRILNLVPAIPQKFGARPLYLLDDFTVMMNSIYISNLQTQQLSAPEPPPKRRRVEMEKIVIDTRNSNPQNNLLMRDSLLAYILMNASSSTLHILHSKCKRYFKLHKHPVCHLLFIQPYAKPRYFQQSLILPNTSIDSSTLNGLIVSNNLTCKSKSKKGRNGEILAALKSKLYKCEASYIHFVNQRVSYCDFIFYIKEGKVKYMNLKNVDISIEDNVLLTPDETRELVQQYNLHFTLWINDKKIC